MSEDCDDDHATAAAAPSKLPLILLPSFLLSFLLSTSVCLSNVCPIDIPSLPPGLPPLAFSNPFASNEY